MIPKPKDFHELMSGSISLLVIGSVLGIGGYAIVSGETSAADWRGAFLVAFAGCVAYWVGSSAGSKRKSDDAANAAKTQVIAAEVSKAAVTPQATSEVAKRIEDAVDQQDK